ncbi:disulfide bond formation protein B [Pseudomonas fluorescens]|uniref:Disulfide bond formation protein B n=1 Tax=Pseudomonas fluorescens TaxID=294 RepID=A0A5E7RHQ4_PSEFL|nr:disulfide bond formation protein B [Pseudomonas fluorescens]VVO07630.1 Disulfide bond formation protein B [Pseudomonas fluorescens]VVP70503.1 Disulfide bond formation protein B [Pseudomonas fluorescens]
MSLACSRSLFFMAFIAGALALGVSYYLEYAVGLQPCGLCLLQRISLALLTGVCLMASVHGPGRFGTFMYWLLGLCCSLAGTVTALRQVLLQSDPVQRLSSCVPNLADLFANTPWLFVVRQMFEGTTECVHISWTLFDLSIPEWSLLFFVAMMILGVCQLLRLVWVACQRPLSGESSHQALVGD